MMMTMKMMMTMTMTTMLDMKSELKKMMVTDGQQPRCGILAKIWMQRASITKCYWRSQTIGQNGVRLC